MVSKKKDRKHMEVAVEEMYKSRSEHKHKSDPKVGTVLVSKDDVVLGKAHRGNLRVGDHAEYTLIERILGNKNLEGSTLYVTLEPCINARKPPKKSCAERIATARIKKVFIGMIDPNPDIQSRGISYLLDNSVDVDFFDIDLVKKIREENEMFIKQYEQIGDRMDKLFEEYKGPSEKEKKPVSSATLNDFSHKIIQDYLAARDRSYDIPSPELWDFFYKNGFITKQKSEERYIPTFAGVLLFGNNPEDFLVQSKVKVEAYHGNKIVSSDITGPLLNIPYKIKEFFENNIRRYTEISELKRIETYEYPWEALREAVVNAIVHRDYNEGARIIIQMLPDKIIIKSPGLPLHPLSLEKIRAYNAPPYSRNPRIADTFCYMKLMEERGWGLSRMRDLLVNHGLRPPEFNYESGYFVVTFFGQEPAVGIISISSDLLIKLNSRQKKIINLIQKRGKITSAECMKKFKIDRRTALRDINQLLNLDILEKRGGGRTTYYILTVSSN